MNRERVLADAKDRALELARAGYHAPRPAHRHPRARREYAGDVEAGRPPDAAGRSTSATTK